MLRMCWSHRQEGSPQDLPLHNPSTDDCQDYTTNTIVIPSWWVEHVISWMSIDLRNFKVQWLDIRLVWLRFCFEDGVNDVRPKHKVIITKSNKWYTPQMNRSNWVAERVKHHCINSIKSIDSILWMTIINSTHNITIITILIWTNNALRCSAAPMPADGSNQARLDIPACWILMIISTAGALVVGITALIALKGKAV